LDTEVMAISFRHINQILYTSKRAAPEIPSIALTCTTTGAQTLGLDNIAVATDKSVTVDWGDGSKNTYTGEAARTHDYAAAGTYTVRFVDYKNLTKLFTDDSKVSGDISGWVLWSGLTYLSLYSTSVEGDISSWTLPASLTHLYLYVTSVEGDISSWTLPASLQYLYLNNTSVEGDISSWTLPASLANLSLYSTSVSGDVSSWTLPASLANLLLNNTSVEGDISSWTLPASLVRLYLHYTSVEGDISGWTLPALLETFLHHTSVEGDISGWTLPASLTHLYLNNTSLEGAPVMTSAVALKDFRYQNCGLLEADVDAVLAAIYARRASFTNATPALNLGSNNEAPSGIYQDGDPPTDGLEYVYELANDPETEGFNTWVITYNGGVAP
jgi:uncharacterized protein YijF (DUF1287 family)